MTLYTVEAPTDRNMTFSLNATDTAKPKRSNRDTARSRSTVTRVDTR